MNPPDSCVTSGCESEGFDRVTIDLPPNQYELVRRLRQATSGPLIGIFVHGGVFALKSLEQDLDAMLDAWYPGDQAGAAIADVLFGRHNPAGRTPVTWYRSNDDLPRNRSSVDWYTPPGYSYRFFQGEPSIPFGHGLSYTSFAYRDGSATESIGVCDKIHVDVLVENVGPLDGDEVVQLYIIPVRPLTPQPKLRLCAFRRLFLRRGERHHLHFEIEPKMRAAVVDGSWFLEEGDLDLWVGGGQPERASGWRGHVHVRLAGRARADACGALEVSV
mmetsp:Transcript_117678/g.375001  ORF Transcript_117678/g.375001 Transcript_117678/m.375001 type:complete len:274 (-) Transcript_117678:41-862(-)